MDSNDSAPERGARYELELGEVECAVLARMLLEEMDDQDARRESEPEITSRAG